MHMEGRPTTFSAKGQRAVAEDDPLVGFLDDVEIAFDTALQVHQHLGDLAPGQILEAGRARSSRR